ncbi:hypothetical protein LTR74_011092 [Friedmanniomyces endolithicus]|nr:hypothetical protein LTR74_011092 [Friedmanniomyces endolithicus]
MLQTIAAAAPNLKVGPYARCDSIKAFYNLALDDEEDEEDDEEDDAEEKARERAVGKAEGKGLTKEHAIEVICELKPTVVQAVHRILKEKG